MKRREFMKSSTLVTLAAEIVPALGKFSNFIGVNKLTQKI